MNYMQKKKKIILHQFIFQMLVVLSKITTICMYSSINIEDDLNIGKLTYSWFPLYSEVG